MSRERIDDARKAAFSGKGFWLKPRGTVTAESDLEEVLCSVRNLPLRFWRERFLFFGARDADLFSLTDSRFPGKLVRRKAHPVFALRALPDGAGFKVCPCTSKSPYAGSERRFIQEGCRLRYTGYVTDRESFLLENISFNIPPSIAYGLRFRGQVPSECLMTWSADRGR